MKADLRLRLTGIGLLLPLAIAMFMGGASAIFALLLISVFLAYELARLLGNSLKEQIFISLLLVFPALMLVAGLSVFVSMALLFLGVISLIYFKSLIAGLYAASLALCFCAFTAFILIPEFHILLLVIGVIISAVDSGAYIVGRKIGGQKLVPKISPNKTVSGAIGGLCFGMIAGSILFPILGMTLGEGIFVSCIISVVAQVGDIFESALKRKLNVKDSSTIIPGHGGFLDRFDGYILVIPLLTGANLFSGTVS